jgi:hypothetical protein
VARGVPGRLKVKPDGTSSENKGGVVEGGLGWVSAKSKVAARGASYFLFLEAEFFEDELFLLEMVNHLDFCSFLLLSMELSLADASTKSFDFLCPVGMKRGRWSFSLLKGRTGPPLILLPRIDQSIAGGGQLFFGDPWWRR